MDHEEPDGEPPKERPRLPWKGLWAFIIATALLGWLFQHNRSFGPINWYFGRYIPQQYVLAGLVSAVVFGSFFYAIRHARRPGSTAARLALIIVLGMGVSVSIALSEGRGEQAFTQRLWKLAHSEFLRIASTQDIDGVVGNYEDMARTRRWIFPRSKPPGNLIVYTAVVRLGDSAFGDLLGPRYASSMDAATRERAHQERIGRVITLVFLLLTFITIVPLYYLACVFLDDEEARWIAVLLYALTPTVSMGVLHLDVALYPLLACTSGVLIVKGVHERRWWMLLAGGVVLSLGLFTTFSLLGVAPLLVGWPVLAALVDKRSRLLHRVRRGAVDMALVLAGLIAVHLVFMLGWGYEPLVRYRDAMEFHANWFKVSRVRWLFGTPAQFFTWLGVPFLAAFSWAVFRYLRPGRIWSPMGLYLAVALALMIVLDVVGHTRVEAQRLWAFWIPFLTIPAALSLRDWETRYGPHFIPGILALEVATSFFIKARYTF
jgi:hypothetical protein